jgi:hypothetical protein
MCGGFGMARLLVGTEDPVDSGNRWYPVPGHWLRIRSRSSLGTVVYDSVTVCRRSGVPGWAVVWRMLRQ